MTATAWDPRDVTRRALGRVSDDLPTALEPQAHPLRAISDLLSDPALNTAAEWVVHRLFVRGSLNVVYGAGKIGKSTMLAHLACCVATGRPFAGHPTSAGPVLWLDLEQGDRRLARSLMAIPGIATPGLPLFVHSDLSDKGRSLSSLRATLRTREFSLVVVDSLGKFAQVEEENANAEWQRTLQPVEELARSGNAALVYIDHDRKSEGEHGRGLRGAGAKLAAMDAAVHVKRVPGKDTARRLEIVSRESGTFALDLTLGLDGYSTATRPADAIETALAGCGSMSLAALLSHLGNGGISAARSTVRGRLEALVTSGSVVSAGAGTKTDPFIYSVAGDVANAGAAASRQQLDHGHD